MRTSRTRQGREHVLVRIFAASITIVLLTAMFSIFLVATPCNQTTLDQTESSENVVVRWTQVSNGLPTTIEYYGVEFGDVNNDGKLDVVAQGPGTHAYIGDGNGNYVEQSTGLPGGGGSVDLILADFNMDGNLDVAASNLYFGNGGRGGTMQWTNNVHPGTWNAATECDFNLDGKPDIISGTASGVRAWAGNGGAGGSMFWTASSGTLPNTGNYWGVKVADLNHDGKPDIVAADRGPSGGIRSWLGNGRSGGGAIWIGAYSGTGLPESGTYADIDLGDVNHDGNLDIVATSLYSALGVTVWLGDGGAGGDMNYTQASAGLDTTTNNYLSVKFADVDNDGNLDIIATHYNGRGIDIWLGNGGVGGTVVWTAVSSGLPTGNHVDLDIGDYNNDGKIDFVTSLNSGVQVWRNDRPNFSIVGYTQMSTGLPTSQRWADVIFDDVNHDGWQDIGFTGFQSGNEGLRVYTGDASGNWVNSSSGLMTSGGFGGMRFADFDHNGTIDTIAVDMTAAPGVHAWKSDGAGAWTQVGDVTTDLGAGLEIGDVNNDGNLDASTGHYSTRIGPSVYLGDGDMGWGANVGPTSTITVDDVTIGDVNHDAVPDLAASSMNNTIGIQLWTSRLSGGIPTWTRNDTGLPTTGVYLGVDFGDMNHDGHLDLAAAGYGPADGLYVYTSNGGAGGSMTWEGNSTGLPAVGDFAAMELCDLNKDGNLDVVSTGAGGGAGGIIARYGNGGAGGSMLWTDPGFLGLPSTGEYWGIACRDVNNDGLPEIGATKNGGVEVWRPLLVWDLQPTVNIIMPVGGESWSGNTIHDIQWMMDDDITANTSLVIYINYSYSGGGGPIAGPLIGLSCPCSIPWTTPTINRLDVTVLVEVIDTIQNKGSDRSNQFEIDSTRPIVQSTMPGNLQTGVPRNTNVDAQWSEAMNRIATNPSFTLYEPNWLPVAGTRSWVGNQFSFNPNVDLIANVWYVANFTTMAKDDSDPGNNLLTLYSWTFRTAPAVDTTPPVVTNANATPNPQEVGSNVNITADVTDDFGVGIVYANVSGPLGWLFNDSMTRIISTSRFYLERTYFEIGLHDFTVWALDTSSNAASALGQFNMTDMTPPMIDDIRVLPGAPDVLEIVNISALITDNYAVYGAWINLTGIGNYSMMYNSTIGRYCYETTFASTGPVTFTIHANDTSDNWNSNASGFAVGDRTEPNIVGAVAQPNPQEVYGYVNITANVTDNMGLSVVSVNVTTPDSSWFNDTMTDGPGDEYYLYRAYVFLGIHQFRIWAIDLSGNAATASGSFAIEDMTPPVINHTAIGSWRVIHALNFTANVTDNFLVSIVRLSFVDVGGTPYNVSMDPSTGDTYFFNLQGQTTLGSITYYFWAVDSVNRGTRSVTYTLSITHPDPNPPENLVVTAESTTSLRLNWDPPTTNEDGSALTNLMGYNVYRRELPYGPWVRINLLAVIQGSTFLDENLQESKTYYYVVRTVNTYGQQSDDSNEAIGTTLSSEQIDFLWIIILILILALIIPLILFLYYRKKKREQEEAEQRVIDEELDAQPESGQQVKPPEEGI